MGTRPVYLDHNATTPVHPQVREAMLPWLGAQWGNPSSAHAYGRQAHAAVVKARAEVAALVGAEPHRVVFTGGGTEADNLALRGPSVARRRIVVSAVEHPAVDLPARALEASGWQRVELPVDARGRVALEPARERLALPAGLLSVILAQNETGVLQPVAELAALARAADPEVLVHTDAAQAVGKIPVDVHALGVDLLTIVSHKLYGPCGIGALYVREGLRLQPLTLGGGQEGGHRPGTEPVALIVGLGAACALASSDLEDEARRVAALRDRLWQRLREAIPGIAWTGEGAPLLPNTLHVRVPGLDGATVLAAAPDVAASTGSACHSEDGSPSGVLGAMGLTHAQARGALRLTLGRGTTEADVDRAALALVAAVRSPSTR
ncbi:cysteine desulfurase family protein [Paraliomyxa miuraensis]|uniref:cysteine desulfurase family protein n=1 Tax=Paraliomyxa miuraensis TaxID=376150 RepID=UPI00225AA42C|nr:cysteine desulfurase family protein [Paraliomyxa miuraensis]MCX4243851.1 cysteine desulfurase [Paraliomyxa miuraensis]